MGQSRSVAEGFKLKPHAGRWEGGALNVPGITAMGASIELLLNAPEIAAVHGLAIAWGVIAVSIVVGRITVVKPVCDDLIDALRLPEPVGKGLGARVLNTQAERRQQPRSRAKITVPGRPKQSSGIHNFSSTR